jgi:hypothetical protein
MTTFSSPYPHDYIYLKVAGCKGIYSAPLCELFAPAQMGHAIYDTKQSTPDKVFLMEPVKDGKQFGLTMPDFIKLLQRDIYKDTLKIVAICIQPEGEMQIPELTEFIEKYNN